MSRATYLLTMMFVWGQINILCKKLTPGGSAGIALKILQEVLKDTFCKKLRPGGSVLTL